MPWAGLSRLLAGILPGKGGRIMTFDQLYQHLLTQALAGEPPVPPPGADPGQLDCLLHPERHPPVTALGRCTCGDGENPCAAACLFRAVVRGPDGQVTIDPERCCGCGACLEACRSGALTASRDVLPALAAVKEARGPVYALVAPAFLGQFSPAVTPGRLRTAFRALGFTGMVEVALFADLLTLKEPPMRILFLIARQFNQILQVKELAAQGMDRAAIASRLKLQPFVVGKVMAQARAFTREQILSYVNLCVDAEESVKTGRLSDRLAVELLIANRY